ncbi:MAG TPA: NAD(P)-dependent oxidoreductase [Thermodesulfobacteriaceae bacterium]|nr:NAD(P)-dependent oxidoreductase [Thermodesulfobacteriaceae bacterium]
MKPKERLAIPRQKPKELSPSERISSFDEVVSGFDHDMAVLEAERCLQCKKPTCRDGCPIHNNIPEFIRRLREGDVEGAYWVVRETSSLPAVCSRVCPHEFQCEGSCVRGKKGDPVSIGMLERYLVDWMVANDRNIHVACGLPKDKKVAIVGAGPAGMTVAYYLAHEGYECTIFDNLPVLGGMLTVGIPAYRLPRDIINKEFDALRGCGVNIVKDVTIGRDKTLEDLRSDGFSAVFLGIGAHSSRKLGIPGEDLEGVIHGVDYLRKINIGERLHLGKKVVVVGGGNVAIDVARCALRTGSDDVFILYRRTKTEMPASQAEIHHLEEEGVKIEFLAAPVAIHGKDGKLDRIECIRMELGECDMSGRCRPVPVDGSNFMIEADAIIPAISQRVDHTALKDMDLKLTSWGTLDVDPDTLQSSVPWIFAGGDAVLGPQTVAKAVYQGKIVAESIRRFLEGEDLKKDREKWEPVGGGKKKK